MSKSFYLMCIAILYFYNENCYFGWNVTPQTDAEMIADGICLILGAFSIMSIKE